MSEDSKSLPGIYDVALQDLMHRSESVNEKISEMQKTLVTKEDLKYLHEALNAQLEKLEANQKELKKELSQTISLTNQHTVAIKTHQDFITNISSGFRWLMRALIVAGLSLSASIFLSFYNGNVARQNSLASPAPIIFPTNHIR
jgi:predicted PurR-regulated permease PerM